jgi:hypothetical protein
MAGMFGGLNLFPDEARVTFVFFNLVSEKIKGEKHEESKWFYLD